MADKPARQLSGIDAAYERLDGSQREAVESQADTVVLAGPGSGKTDTLAVKAAVALQEVPSPRGVACITFTRAAAREIRLRVDTLGVNPGRRLVASTLHSFCLRQVIRPFASLVGESELARREVVAQNQAAALLKHACNTAGTWITPTQLQLMRRAAAVGEDLAQLVGARDIDAMERYEELLTSSTLIDYDGMVHEALRLVRAHEIIVDLLVARFPWVLVDEYQDLGGPLHHLVQTLRVAGGAKIFAVGDPDQTILQFTGADAQFLESLRDNGFHLIELPTNYRSGAKIIRASSAVGSSRTYEADPTRLDEGEVLPMSVEGGLAPQAEVVAKEVVPRFLDAWPAHEIAVLYPARGWLLDCIVSELGAHHITYSLERDARFPQLGEIIAWLQQCAQWAIDAWAERQGRFRELADDLREYLVDAEHPAGRTSLAAAEFLYPLIEDPVDPDMPLDDWLGGFVSKLNLNEILSQGGIHAQDQEALAALRNTARQRRSDISVQTFAGPVRRPGRIVVTTYHSAKGREFDAVILPGLQNGIIPRARKVRGQWRMGNVDHDRNLFYVALTRARHSVALLSSEVSEDGYGDPAKWPRSPFLEDVLATL